MLKNQLKFFAATCLATALLGACATKPESPQEASCQVNPPKEPMACTMQWDPVCGCDGKTYGNACSARGAGVSSFVPGACEKDSTE